MASKDFEVQQLLKAYRKGLISDELFAQQMAEMGAATNGHGAAANGQGAASMSSPRPKRIRVTGDASLDAPGGMAMLTQKGKTYDRAAEDLGNIVALEHVNVTVPSQETAALFYVNGLGLTRDPYMMTGPANMWVNAGRQQFHLPTSKAQVLRGHIGVVVSDYDQLPKRLARAGEALTGKRFGPMAVGVPYVEFDVPMGTAAGIARFYSEIMEAQAAPLEDAQGRFACV